MSEKPVEIRVGGKTNPQKLAGSIVAALGDGHQVKLLAIGPLPTGQAFKAVVIANRMLASNGEFLCIIPALETRSIPSKTKDGEEESFVISTMRLRDVFSVERKKAEAT